MDDAGGIGDAEAGDEDRWSPPDNPIVRENALPGTVDWAIAQPAPNHEIEAYADAVSAAPGDVVQISVSTSVTSSFRWKLFRLGYYGGLGGRFLEEDGPLPAHAQAPCPVRADTGLVECAWTPSFRLTVDPTWITGQYALKLTRQDGFETYVPLTIREATPHAPLLVQASVTTWQAYNPWGGSSLYVNGLPPSVGFYDRHAHQVSFDRPYDFQKLDALESLRGAAEHFYSERFFFQWLERQGYDVAYATNLDIDADPGLLGGRKLFTSVGHDEYWSLGERHAVQSARDDGLSLGFFSGNSVFWRIRFDASSSGKSRRVITCYKDAKLDPVHDAEDTTTRYHDPPHAEPENALMGQMSELFSMMDSFPLIAGDPSHWIYRGTRVSRGEVLSNVVGYEWDRAIQDENTPAGLEVVAMSPMFGSYGSDSPANATVYYPTPRSIVFSAGTIQWSWGLGKPGYEDARIEKITENVLARAGVFPKARVVVPPPSPPEDVGVATRVDLIAGTGLPGHVDGDGAKASFDGPAGVAVDASGNILVTEARNHVVRKIAPDGAVSTLAGCGPDDSVRSSRVRNGQGGAACFDTPTGIAVGLDGTIYVSDSHNSIIRSIDSTGKVESFAGITGDASFADAADRHQAQFAYPRGLAVGPDGALYVADAGNSAIRKIDSKGVTTLFQGDAEISGVAVGPDGTVYALVSGNNQVSVLRGSQLVPIANAAGTPGDQSGPGAAAMLRPSDGIIVDGDSVIVADSANEKVRRIALTADHTVTTLVGDGPPCDCHGNCSTSSLRNPRGLALTSRGYLVADSGNHRILRIVP